jgi:cytochrome c oxidase cbb3-type subunit 3/ubiquinol-cytochrome c reductase cytochrome c subunit
LGCSNGSAKPQPDPPAQQPRDASTADADPTKLEGAALYQTYCSQCHGPDAKGYKADNAPSLVNKTFLESATDEFIHKSIAVGRPGTSMAGYGSDIGGPLDHMAIGRIVRWLRSDGTKSVPLAAAPTTGNAKRGAAVYAAECQKCHGDATTRVNAVHLANPQFLALASDAFIRHAIVVGRPGTPMLPFEGKLTPQQIDDVTAYVRAFGKPPEVAKAPEGAKEGKDAKATPAAQNVEIVEPTPPTGKEPLVINPKGKAPVWKATRPDPTNGNPRFVSVDEVKRAMDEKRKMVIIDARPPSDWMRARIKGAVSIPYHDLKRVSEIPKDTWVIAYCACPHHLSGIVVEELWKRGHQRALVLDEGVLEWHRRGYPMITAPGVPVPPKEDHSGHNHGHHGHGH